MPMESEFKGLIRSYMESGVSRRDFLTTLTGIGLSAGAAHAVAQEFSPFVTRLQDSSPAPLPEWVKPVSGNGGKLLVEQLKASGQKFFFVNPSSGQAPIFDALVDTPEVQIIESIHEGALVAMADGYAKASGETPWITLSRPGLPNAMSMMFNSWKDYTPMLVLVDDVSESMLSQDGFQAMDHMTSMTQTMTKWNWSVQSEDKIPEILRRGHKFAATRPSRPVFVAIPQDYLARNTQAAVIGQEKYSVAMQLRPSQEEIGEAAKLLLSASNPLILAGDEVRYCQAQAELLELAELLAIPVVKEWTASWSKPFPTKHPLYLGNYLSTSRFPGKVDVLLNVGSRMPLAGSQFRMESQVRLIQLRVDADNLARVYPTELAMVADIRLALADLLQELKRQASSRQLRSVVGQRMERARVHRKSTDEAYGLIARERWNNDPISGERVMVELEGLLEKDTLVVSDNDSYMGVIDNYLSYGPQDKDYFFSTGFTLGWGLPAAFGVKLAMPDRPVVCVVSDGSFLFSGPQPLWSYSRYQAPVLVIVMNNRSYNNERNRIMARRGRAYQAGRDMVCYLGDPDVNYVKLAEAFDVQAEEVKKPEDFRSAVQRGMKATAAGRAYLLDVHVERTGSLANSTWHPAYSISSTRSRSV